MQNLKEIKNFSLEELTKLYTNANTVVDGKILKKDITECKKYIIDTIYNLNDGNNVCIFENGDLKIMDNEKQFSKMFFNRFPSKELKEWFKTSPEIIYYKLSCEKSELSVDKVNKKLYNTPKIKAVYKPYETYTNEVKESCNLMLSHIKEINCGGDNEQFIYLLKLLKRMCQGIKNNVAIFIHTFGQGNGKSTFLKLLEQFIIGEKSSCVATAKMVTSGFNFPMFNKILIKFEELPCFSKEQYKGISGNFKTWITEDYINYEDKNKSSFDSFNCHTLFVLSNNECIDDDDGRRWFILDHKDKFIDDEEAKKKYFKNLYSRCFNEEVANCFYSYLIDKIEIAKGFDPNSEMPMTKNKQIAIAQKLAKPFVFIKEFYLLKQLNINKKMKELYTEYTESKKYYNMNISTFNKHFKESVFSKYIKESGGYDKLRISNDELKQLYIKNKWINEFDEFEIDTIEKEVQDMKTDYELLFQEQIKKNEENEKQIKELQEQIKLLQQTQKIEKHVEIKTPVKSKIVFDDLENDLLELEKEFEIKTTPKKTIKTTKPKIIKDDEIEFEIIQSSNIDNFFN
jgi:hypothetical protein